MALETVKNAILKGPAAMSMLVKFIEAHEARQAAREALTAKSAALYPGRRLSGSRAGVELRQTNRSSMLVNPRTPWTPA